LKTGEEIDETDWAQVELSEVDLADSRLNDRFQQLGSALGKQPLAPINAACEDWADSKAAYRFFDNEKVTPEKILSPHSQRTVERMQGHPVILAIQDTTFFNFTQHPNTDGLGEIGRKSQNQRGFAMHSTLAVSPAGQPLGLLTEKFILRELGEAAYTPQELQKLPIEQKESYRWLQSLEKTIELTPENVQVVTVCDREADIYEMFVLGQEQHASLLVRASENRSLQDDEVKHLWAKVEQKPIVGELDVHLRGNQKRQERQTKVSIRFCSVKLRPPWRPEKKKLPVVNLHAILVREEHPPENLAELGHEPIEWLLLTNTSVNDFAEALRVVEWYCCRWQIEVFHKIIKSGCRVEDCLLQTADRLKNYIALMSIVAWRLQWLTYLNRTEPDLPCTTILTTIEWQALYMRIHKTTKFPKTPPSVHQAIRWIAQLGGFLGRKSDGEPGIIAIWRGWQRLQDLADTWNIVVHDRAQLVGNR
jgi:hypothetical protein